MSLDTTNSGPLISSQTRGAWLLEARELLRLALPLAATQVAQMIILATDTLMLGHFSKAALAAAALGNTIFFCVWLFGSGPTFAVSSMVAHIRGRHVGAAKPRDRRAIRAVTRMAMWAVVLMSPPLLALLAFTRPLLILFRQEPTLADGAADLHIRRLPSACPLRWAFRSYAISPPP